MCTRLDGVLRVLHLTNAGGDGRVQLGGGERAVADLTRYFSEELGWTVGVAAPRAFLDHGTLAPSVATAAETFSWAGEYRLLRLIRAFRPTVVVTHLLRATLVGQPAAAAAGVPVRISNLHNSMYDIQTGQSSRRRVRRTEAYRTAYRAVTRWCTDATVAISEPNRLDLIERDHIAARKVRLIHNWVAPAFFGEDIDDRAREIVSQYGLSASGLRLGLVGRLERQKNVGFAIELLKRLPHAHLVVVGDGTARQEAERLARDIDVASRVTFVGYQRDVAAWFATFDVLLVPSRFEGFGRVAAEALAVGVPVVGSDAPGLASLLASVGRPGAVSVSLAQPEAWAASIEAAAHARSDPSARQRLRHRMASQFGLSEACTAYRDLYLELLTTKQAQCRRGRSSR